MSHRDNDRLSQAKSLHLSGALDDARTLYEKLRRKHPNNSAVQSLLGALLVDQGHITQALPLLSQAAKRRKDDADTQHNLGIALSEKGDVDSAIQCFKRAIVLAPQHPIAHYSLGLALRQQGDFDRSTESLQRDFRIQPRPDSARLLAKNFTDQGDLEQAHHYASECVTLAGATWDDLNRLIYLKSRCIGNGALVSQDMQADAIALAEHARSLNPTCQTALMNCSSVYSQLGMFQEALAPLKQLVQSDPENASAHSLLALCQLTLGDLQAGWHERTVLARMREPTCNGIPRWQGQRSPGFKLWVKTEQGVGDQILYARMFTDLIDAGMEITFASDKRLHPTLARSMPELTLLETLSSEQQAQQDAFTTLGELHLYLRPNLSAIPKAQVYLRSDKTRTGEFRSRYRSLYPDKTITGLAWQSHSAINGAAKSVELDTLLPILKSNDRVFVCAQYGQGWGELEAHASKHGYRVHFDADCNSLTDLDAGFAQLAAMDELVSVSNATVHMAGALGKRVHVLVGRRSVWHWFTQGQRSPWYSDVHLYRQSCLDSWADPVAKLTTELNRAKP